MKTTKNLGRPKAKEPFNCLRTINLTEEDKKRIEERAQVLNIDRSALIRHISLTRLVTPDQLIPSFPDEEFICPIPVRWTYKQDEELRRLAETLGVSINQFIRFAIHDYMSKIVEQNVNV